MNTAIAIISQTAYGQTTFIAFSEEAAIREIEFCKTRNRKYEVLRADLGTILNLSRSSMN